MGGWPGKGARLLCPGDLYNEHDELESVLKRCKKINRQTEEFERTLQKAPNAGGEKQKVLMDCLYAQRELYELEIKWLRQAFSGKVDDLQGVDTNASTQMFYPSSKYACEKKNLDTIVK